MTQHTANGRNHVRFAVPDEDDLLLCAGPFMSVTSKILEYLRQFIFVFVGANVRARNFQGMAPFRCIFNDDINVINH